MVEQDKVYKGRFRQAGIFSFKDFYEYLYELLHEYNYDVFEEKYSETKKGEAKNIGIMWRAEKSYTKSNYFKVVIKIEWLLLGLTRVKVKKDNQEETMDSGSMELAFSADLLKDANDEWENSSLKFLRKFYDNSIIKSRIQDYEFTLYEEINEIISNAKAFLAIEGKTRF